MNSNKRTKSALITTKTCAKDLAVIAQWFDKNNIQFDSAYEFMDCIVAEFTKAVISSDPSLKILSLSKSIDYLYNKGIKKIAQGNYGKTLQLKALQLEKDENSESKKELEGLGIKEEIEGEG